MLSSAVYCLLCSVCVCAQKGTHSETKSRGKEHNWKCQHVFLHFYIAGYFFQGNVVVPYRQNNDSQSLPYSE